MQTMINRFLWVETIRVYADRRSCAVCGGQFIVTRSPNLGNGPITPQSRTVVAHHERGELDGAKEVDGG